MLKREEETLRIVFDGKKNIKTLTKSTKVKKEESLKNPIPFFHHRWTKLILEAREASFERTGGNPLAKE